MTALGRQGHCGRQGLQVERPVLNGLQRCLCEGSEEAFSLDLSRRAREADVLVLVVRHGPCDLEKLLKCLYVDRHHPVDLLVLDGFPHRDGNRPDLVEVGGEPEIAPVLTWLEPTPPCCQVSAHLHGPGRHLDGPGVRKGAHLHVAVIEREGSCL